jgi:hypothetical protein
VVLHDALSPGKGTLLVGIGLDQAGVHGKTVTTHQPVIEAPLHHRLEQVMEQILALALLRADAKAVADQQHADHQRRIDGGPACDAVEAGETLSQLRAADEPVDAPQDSQFGRALRILTAYRPSAHAVQAACLTLDQQFHLGNI